MKSLREHVKDLKVQKKRDYDPEDEPIATRSGDSESEDEAGASAGREHYETVAKSKLRKPEVKVLGKQYEGVSVSRAALNQDEAEDEDDPFAPVHEEEEDDDPFALKSGKKSKHDGDESPDDNMLEGASDVDEEMEADAEDILDGDEGDDPEIDSDEAFEEGDEERFRAKGFTFKGMNGIEVDQDNTGSLYVGDEEDDEDEDQDVEDDEASQSEGSDLLSDEDMEDKLENETSDEESSYTLESFANQATARPSLSKSKTITSTTTSNAISLPRTNETSSVASALSAGVAADVRKGIAVKQQYQTFDRILDARIKLQKGITSSNELQVGSITDEDAKDVVQKAEQAALTLWSTIDSIRRGFLEHSQTQSTDSTSQNKKRKTPPTVTAETTSSELWQRSNTLETSIIPYRRAILDKWSRQTRTTTPAQNSRSKLVDSTPEPSFTSVFDRYLSAQSTLEPSSDPFTYDDSNFYQSLLVDLISTRSALDVNGTDPSVLNTSGPLKLHPSGSKNKKVDTKASKGRKVRYTVHEKLENFMAPEDRTTWGDAARTEFFGSLFGQRNLLAEEEGGELDEMVDGQEVEALKLFRS